ncbi:MAG TPA: DUF2304 domain-containing protein [Patescibacteria group bacterium]|nr:DUF2304 domain-containing protein [Patescibacteria group bacterium]
MILFQALLIFFILVIISRLILRLKHQEIRLIYFFKWLLFWLIVIGVIIFPEIINFLARNLGIGRGVDVAIYFALLLLFYFIFYLTVHIRSLESKVTKLARKIALNKKDDES